MRVILNTLLAAVMLLVGSPLAAEVDEAQLQASALVAQNWLAIVDRGDYSQSWEETSQLMKITVSRNEWIRILNAMRKPLGNLVTRQKTDQRPAYNPNGLPGGNYMVLVYQTNFSARPNANELVTMVQGYDGQWRVLTYQVR